MPQVVKSLTGFVVGFGLSVGLLSLTLPGSYPAVAADAKVTGSVGYQVTKWVDLIPPDDLAALLNPPSSLERIMDGSADDSLENLEKTTSKSPYGKALKSMRIIPEFNHKKIRIPGFVVPVESDDDQRITSFFLVPYFGACLHLPPPPPNQIIYATYVKGLKVDVLYAPFWIEGTLQTDVTETALATSAYTMVVDRIEDYGEDDEE